MEEFGPAVQVEDRPDGSSVAGPEDQTIDHDTQWEAPPAPGSGSGGWGDVPWQPAANEPTGPAHSPTRKGAAALAIAAMVFASGGVGVAIGANLHHRLTSAATSTLIPQPGASTPAPNGVLPSPGSTAPASGSPSTGSGSTVDAAAIAAAVDPAIVDINTTLTNGQAAGTGMVLTSSGLVLTNNHVIDGATSIQVQIDGTGPQYTASVVGYDVTHDVALLQMQNVSGLKTIPVGDSSKVAVNDPVVAIGNALGRSGPPAVTQGSVSALDQSITANDTTGNSETLNGTIQINAPIQPGDSGGALVNSSGQVIGLNTAAAGGYRRYSASSVAFAIPINSALSIARQIQAGQASATIHLGVRGVLGVEVQPASQAGNPFGSGTSTAGAPVVGTASGSPAAAAGLVAGDVITSVGDKTITASADLQTALNPFHPGDRVTIGWVDGSGQHHTATVALIPGPPA